MAAINMLKTQNFRDSAFYNPAPSRDKEDENLMANLHNNRTQTTQTTTQTAVVRVVTRTTGCSGEFRQQEFKAIPK